jgi:hypothetical protein
MANPSIFLTTHLLFLTSSLISSLVFYLCSRPRRAEVLATLAGGLLLTWRFGLFGPAYAQAMVFLSYWSVFAIAVSFFAPLLFQKQIKQRVPVLEAMLAPPALELLAAVLLGYLNRLVPNTLDYYLFAFDGSLGFQPGFAVAQFLARHAVLRIPAECAYLNLTLAFSVAYLLQRKNSVTQAQLFLRFIIWLGVAGFAFYAIFPAAGTEVLFRGRFPQSPPAIAEIAIRQTPDLIEPRNCLPSLHTAWVLALWYTCPKRRVLRVCMGAYAAFTLLYTLSCGHYLADMIVAVPFTAAIYAITYFSGKTARDVAVASAGMFLGWLVLLRFGTPLFLAAPIIPWSLSVATIGTCHFLRRRLESDPAILGNLKHILAGRPFLSANNELGSSTAS